MRNRLALALVCGMSAGVVGCSRSAPQPARTAPAGEPVVASALVYTPPVARDIDVDAILARDDRGPTAFVGFDSAGVETYFLRVDDRHGFTRFPTTGGAFFGGGFGVGGGGWGGRTDVYQRRAVSTRTFVRER